jgi:hypothetical protein
MRKAKQEQGAADADERLRQAIREGGSVLHAGRVIRREDELPSPDELKRHEEQLQRKHLEHRAMLDGRLPVR